MPVSPYEYALLAQAAYAPVIVNDFPRRVTLPAELTQQGWRYITCAPVNDVDYFAIACEKTERGIRDVVIAHRGTITHPVFNDIWQLNDQPNWKANSQIAIAGSSLDFGVRIQKYCEEPLHTLLELSRDFSKTIFTLYPKTRISVTGHSLGGFLVCTSLRDLYFKENIGDLVTFDSFGAGSYVEHWNEIRSFSLFFIDVLQPDSAASYASVFGRYKEKITHYQASRNLVNGLLPQVLSSRDNRIVLKLVNDPMEEINKLLFEVFKNIENTKQLLSALQEPQGQNNNSDLLVLLAAFVALSVGTCLGHSMDGFVQHLLAHPDINLYQPQTPLPSTESSSSSSSSSSSALPPALSPLTGSHSSATFSSGSRSSTASPSSSRSPSLSYSSEDE